MVCKIIFWSEFPNIPKKLRRRRRSANAKMFSSKVQPKYFENKSCKFLSEIYEK